MKRIILFLTLFPFVLTCAGKNPRVVIRTELGDITVELYPDKAPVTVANFLKYVKEKRFKEATFYRTVTADKQPSLDYGGMRNPDGQGFAAFGKVVAGMDVVCKIHRSPAEGQWLKPRIRFLSVEVLE